MTVKTGLRCIYELTQTLVFQNWLVIGLMVVGLILQFNNRE